jgi:hypothetical protein
MLNRSRLAGASVAKPGECRAFVERDVLGLVALDLVLRRFSARMVRVAFDVKIASMYANNYPVDAAGLRIPAHMIANLEVVPHGHSAQCLALRISGALQPRDFRIEQCLKLGPKQRSFVYLTFTLVASSAELRRARQPGAVDIESKHLRSVLMRLRSRCAIIP